jgi:hypothetical protein
VLGGATNEMPPGMVLWVNRDGFAPGSDPMHREWME